MGQQIDHSVWDIKIWIELIQILNNKIYHNYVLPHIFHETEMEQNCELLEFIEWSNGYTHIEKNTYYRKMNEQQDNEGKRQPIQIVSERKNRLEE